MAWMAGAQFDFANMYTNFKGSVQEIWQAFDNNTIAQAKSASAAAAAKITETAIHGEL